MAYETLSRRSTFNSNEEDEEENFFDEDHTFSNKEHATDNPTSMSIDTELSASFDDCLDMNDQDKGQVISSKCKSSNKEKKVWSVIKNVPVFGGVYGAIRSPIYAAKGDRDEAYRSLAGCVGNIAGTGAAVVGACMSGPLIVPVLASIVGGGAVQQVVGGGGEAIIDGSKGKFQALSNDEKEIFLYERIFRDTPLVGGAYSLIRGQVYKSRNPEESSRSYKDAAINGISSGVALGLGYKAAKVAANVGANSGKLARGVKRSRVTINDGLKRTPALSRITVHELEEICADVIPKATERVMQVLMILEDSFHCIGSDCKISNRLRFLVSFLLDQTSGDHLLSSSFLPIAVLRGGIAFIQVILCLKPGLKDHLALAREFIEISEEELRSSEMSLTRRTFLEIRLELIRYFLEVLDPNSSVHTGRSYQAFTLAQRKLWSRTDFRKYKVETEPAIVHRPTLEGPQMNQLGIRILNLDGGGTRGILLLEFLEEIENRTQKRICECFDYICGTSSGGIIALCLAKGYSVTHIRELFFKLKNKVFSGRRPYNHVILEKELKDALGEDATMGDISGVKVIITCSVLVGRTFETNLFTNFDSDTMGVCQWEAARCTSAAPSYFEPFTLTSLGKTYYDGGLGANNPTMEAIYKISDNEVMKRATIVSLGTGKTADGRALSPPLNVDKSLRMVFNGELKRILDILVEQVAKSDGQPVNHAMKTSEWMEAFYYRLTPVLPKIVDLDETDDEILINMIFHTKAYLNANSQVIHEISELISRNEQEFV